MYETHMDFNEANPDHLANVGESTEVSSNSVVIETPEQLSAEVNGLALIEKELASKSGAKELTDLQKEVSNEKLTKLSLQRSPGIKDIASKELDDAVQAYVDQYESVESLSEVYAKIDKVQREFLGRYFADFPGSKAFMDTLVTATSLHMFASFSGGGFDDMESRDSVFANAENLKIDKNEQNLFGKLKDWGTKINPQSLFKLSGMMNFFGVFKDPDIQKVLSPIRDKKTGLIKNYYLANPHKLQVLMSDYTNPEIAGEDKKARLKKQLLAGQMDAKTGPSDDFMNNYEITTSDTKKMKETIKKYGANPAEFKQFMSYVDQGEAVLGQVEGIKKNLLESPQVLQVIESIVTAKAIMKTLGMDGLFDLFDSILNRFGFDGIDGYMNEHRTHKHIGPLLKDYASLSTTPESKATEPSVYGTVLSKLTSTSKEKKLGEKTMKLGATVDIHALYALMSGENTKQQNYISAEKLDMFIPAYDRAKFVTDEEKFMAASAYVMKGMGSSKLLTEINDADESEKLLGYMMTFLARPKDAQKHFSPEYIWKQDASYEKKMKVFSDGKNKPKDEVASKEDQKTITDPVSIKEVGEDLAGSTLESDNHVEMIESSTIQFKNPEMKGRLPLMSEKALVLLGSLSQVFSNIRITSMVRTKEENDALHLSAETSQHMYGHGFDIGRPTAEFVAGKQKEYEEYFTHIKDYIDSNFPDYYTLIHGEGAYMHLHVDTREESEDKAYYTNADIDQYDNAQVA